MKTIKMTIYRRLLVKYTIVILIIIVLFEFYLISNVRKQIINGNINNNQIVSEEVGNYIKKISDTSDLILYKLHQSDAALVDTILFLENPVNEYYQKKLNLYTGSDSSDYQGMDDFAVESFQLNSQLIKISYVSTQEKSKISFGHNGEVRTNSVASGDIKSMEKEVLVEDNNLTFVKDIQNPYTMNHIGYLLMTYNGDFFDEAFKKNTKSELVVFYKDREIIYNSVEDDIVNYLLNENGVLLDQKQMEKVLNSYVSYYGVNGVNIIRYMPKNKAEKIPKLMIGYSAAMGLVLFAIGEILVYRHLEHLTYRLKSLLIGMERVKEGDIESFVNISNENDEYDIIADNFNKMCIDLKTYIQKSYLAEIDQKNAEINALQSQINPHFLYNTLEVIRMKAICNGDTEVGKMLYGLAFIFRSQIKESDIITVAKELYYCKKYMELFEFRYQNKFKFEINYKEEYMELPIIKFIIQPIIENYFVHGIRLKDNDNLLKINIEEDNGDLMIVVEDNGKGMTQEDIDLMNENLKQSSVSIGSIGVYNVYRRIVATYGNEYGVWIEKNNGQGLRVILKFPKEVKHV